MESPEREVRWARACQSRPGMQCVLQSSIHAQAERIWSSFSGQRPGLGWLMRDGGSKPTAFLKQVVCPCSPAPELRMPLWGSLRAEVEGRAYFKEPWHLLPHPRRCQLGSGSLGGEGGEDGLTPPFFSALASSRGTSRPSLLALFP